MSRRFRERAAAGSPQRSRNPNPARDAERSRKQQAHAPGTASTLVYGLRAAIAVLEVRPSDVLRIGYMPDVSDELAPILRAASKRGVPCSDLREAELTRLAQSDQHEGIVLETKPRAFVTPAQLGERLVQKKGLAVAFDRVRNPYNVGAVLRTAAFFGVDAALLGNPAPHPALAPQAVRVAEGGAEHLMLARTTDLAETLSRLRKAGVLVLGAEEDGQTEAARHTAGRARVLVLGHEREGLSERVRAQCDAVVAIRGSGRVRSLNVSIAASILIAELMRDHAR
jgi:TrmH RNA methyltransferase